MALEVVGSSPTTHPIYFPKAFFAQDWGVAKRLRPRILIPVYAGSNPATPAKYDPLAQSVEHLTFNQGVRSSNLRWITKEEVLKSLCINDFKAFFISIAMYPKIESVVTL